VETYDTKRIHALMSYMGTSLLRQVVRYKWLIVLFFLGWGFRIFLFTHFPQPILWDQQRYDMNAEKIFHYKVYIDSFRPAGYPIFLAVVYGLFGLKNYLSVYLLQAGIDCVTGVVIFFLANRFFRQKRVGWIAYVLYLANPYTSAYAGMLLPETISTWLLTISVYLIWKFMQEKKIQTLVLLGLTLGLMPQMKISFYYFSIVVMIALIWKILKTFTISLKDKIGLSVVLCLSFFVCCFYAMQANSIYYQEVSPTIVDYMSVQNLYISLFVDHFVSSPTYTSTKLYPDRLWDMYDEFSRPLTKEGRQDMAWKYLSRSEFIIASDPMMFITSRFKKLWYIWEKHYIFAYKVESDNRLVNELVYWVNFITIIIAVIGLFLWLKRDRSEWTQYMVFIIMYITLMHTLTGAEERYSIPAYPLVYLFCGYAATSFLVFVQTPKRTRGRPSKS
jgi:hypothetical protein